MCLMCQTLDPTKAYDAHVDSLGDGGTGTSYDAAGLPVYSIDQIADYLTDGFWLSRGQQPRSFNVQTGGNIFAGGLE